MIHKSLDSITPKDLQLLKSNEVAESKTLEYKRELPGDAPDERKKLLRTVCAFANTDGGDLVYGIEAENGIPVDLPGIEVSSEDSLRLRLENSLRDAIEPRVTQLQMRLVPLASGKSILIIRVQKSWNAPHRLSKDGHFYGRNSGSTYPLDVGEVRRVFTLSEAVPERIRNFRADRLLKIASGETPVPIVSDGTMVLHIVPLSAFASTHAERLDFSKSERNAFPPLDASGWSSNVNLDGYVNFTDRNEASSAYTQLFRTGVVEVVGVFQTWEGSQRGLPAHWIEEQVIQLVSKCTAAFAAKGLSPPLYVFLSFVKVRGYFLDVSVRYRVGAATLLNRDNLAFPEVTVEQQDFDAADAMRPLFDMMWNAFGFEGSFNYDETGKRRKS